MSMLPTQLNWIVRTLKFTSLCLLPIVSTPGQATRRDSAGVKITSFKVGAPTGVLKLAVKPSVDIGSAAGGPTQELARVRAAVRLKNGTIVVANSGTLQLRMYDSTGRHLRDAGRKGNGPGEFQSMEALYRMRGDSLLVYDFIARRIVVFGPAGLSPLTIVMQSPTGRREPSLLGVLTDGTLLTYSLDVNTLQPRPQPYYLTRHLFTYGRDGNPLSDIGTFMVSEHFAQQKPPETGGNVANWSLAFGRVTTITPLSTGFLVGDGTSLELKSYSPKGVATGVLRGDLQVLPVTTADRDAYRKDNMTDVSAAQKSTVEKMINEMPYPKNMPVFAKFLAADDGRIWIKRYAGPAEKAERWIVIDGQGNFVDEVTTPAGFKLMSAGANYVLGVSRDSDEAEHVQLFRLGK